MSRTQRCELPGWDQFEWILLNYGILNELISFINLIHFLWNELEPTLADVTKNIFPPKGMGTTITNSFYALRLFRENSTFGMRPGIF